MHTQAIARDAHPPGAVQHHRRRQRWLRIGEPRQAQLGRRSRHVCSRREHNQHILVEGGGALHARDARRRQLERPAAIELEPREIRVGQLDAVDAIDDLAGEHVQRAAHLARRREGARKPLLAERARARRISNVDQHHAAGLLMTHGIDDEHRCHAFGQEQADGQSAEWQRDLDAGSIGARHAYADQSPVAREGDQMVSHDRRRRARVKASLVEEGLPRLG
jgi:hypothetical protein